MAYITTTSEGDYNAQWENVGIPDDFNGSKPHHDRELFRLLQRPCGLLTALKKLRIAFLPLLLLLLFRTGFGTISKRVRVRKESALPVFQQLASGLTSYGIRKGVDRALRGGECPGCVFTPAGDP